MEGLKKCDLHQCGYEEFLVWKCDYCRRSFCNKHKARLDHNCPSTSTISLTDSVNEVTNTGGDVSTSSTESSFPSAQDMFRSVETRHDYLDHMATGKIHANVKSSTLQKDVKYDATLDKVKQMETVMETTKSEKQMSIAQKTKSLLQRSRAVGNGDIAQNERIYISVLFPLSSTTRNLFFHNNISVGSALQHISESFTLLAYGTPVRPESMTLTFNIEETTSTASEDSFVPCRWNNNSLLRQHTTDEFIELSVHPILIADSVRDQRELIAQENQLLEISQSEKEVNCPNASAPVSKEETFDKGDRVIYRQVELAVIMAVHREEDPPFYTIQLSGEGGRIREKQTDGMNLTLFKEPPISTTSTGNSETPSMQGSGDTAVFSIRLSSGGKVRRVEGVPLDGTVSDLKRVVSMQTGVLPAKQKLLYKGKVLKDDNMKLKNDGDSALLKKSKVISVEDNGMVMMMTISK
mmetsp:Transcript_11508/g.21358  ORF Transcript_11508/g.21358 Transcript_11508/m.21358 type:complete len:465 (+) Transcript_11508:113-1507(+)